MGPYIPQPISVIGPTPILSPSFILNQAIFKPNTFVYKNTKISQNKSFQLAGKCKATEPARSAESSEPANSRTTSDTASALLPKSSLVTVKQAAVSNKQLGPPEFVFTYAGVLAGSEAPLQQSESFKATASCSELHVPAVSTETADTRMSTNMSGPLSDKPDGNTPIAIVANTCLQAGQRPNKTPIFLIGISDAHSFLSWLRSSCPGGPMAQLKGDNLMDVP
jgi:hypothetical protein